MSAPRSPQEALAAAIEIAGSQSKLARGIGCSAGRISQLVVEGLHLGAEYVLRAEAMTGVPRQELRPDLYPVDLADGPYPKALPRASCATCLFYLPRGVAASQVSPDKLRDIEQADLGVCRRVPPVVVGDDPEIGIAVSVFPVIHQGHWCGKWEGTL